MKCSSPAIWCGAGGWRLGTCSFPEQLRWLSTAISNMGSETFSATSAPIQYAAVRAFAGGQEIEDYLARVRWTLAGLTGWATELLRGRGATVVQPVGAFYLFPDFGPRRLLLAARGIHTDRDLAERLLDECGVTSLPGTAFGMPERSLYLRLALVDFDGARVLASPRGSEVDEAFLHRYCAPTHEALRTLAAWV